MAFNGSSSRDFGHFIALLCGIFLFVGVLVFRYLAPTKIEVGFSDVLLLALPSLLWLLASGQLESLKFGSSGFQIKSAILKASSASINLKVKKINFSKTNAINKEGLSRLPSLLATFPEAIALILRTDNYYDEYVLAQYLEELRKTASFKYLLFFERTPSHPFVGGISATDFFHQLVASPPENGTQP